MKRKSPKRGNCHFLEVAVLRGFGKAITLFHVGGVVDLRDALA